MQCRHKDLWATETPNCSPAVAQQRAAVKNEARVAPHRLLANGTPTRSYSGLKANPTISGKRDTLQTTFQTLVEDFGKHSRLAGRWASRPFQGCNLFIRKAKVRSQVLGKVTPCQVWLKVPRMFEVCRLLGNATSSKLWMKVSVGSVSKSCWPVLMRGQIQT